MRWLALRCGLALLVAYTVLVSAGGVLLAELALHPARRPIIEPQRKKAFSQLIKDGASVGDVQVVAQDGAILRGWFVPARRPNGNVVILLHGVSDNRLGMYGYAQPLLHAGFDVLLPDARAHGESGGSVATYGLLERDDIGRWAAWLRSRGEHCVDGLGESMGAGHVLQAVGTAQFCAVVAESGFSDFSQIAYDRIGYHLHFGEAWIGRTVLRPAVWIAFAYAWVRYGLNFGAASPERVVANSSTPILLIHGQEDTNIRPWHSVRLHQVDVHSDLWLVAGAEHCGAVSVDKSQFWRRVLGEFGRDELRSANAHTAE